MNDPIEVTTFLARRVAFMRCVGPYGSRAIGDLWRRFEARRLAHGLRAANARVLGVAQDNPNITPPHLTWVRFLTRTLPEAGLVPDLAPAIEIYDAGPTADPTTGALSCQLCMPLCSS